MIIHEHAEQRFIKTGDMTRITIQDIREKFGIPKQAHFVNEEDDDIIGEESYGAYELVFFEEKGE